MVAPLSIDLKVAQRLPFFTKAKLAKKPSGSFIFRNASRLQSMQPERSKREWQHCPQSRKHLPLPGIGPADPIAQCCRLGHPASHIGNGTAAEHDLVAAAEDQKRVSHVIPNFTRIAPQASPKRGPRQFVRSPYWLPGR